MNYSKSLLGKDLKDLNYKNIVDYFRNSHSESNIAEYKSYNPEGDFGQKLNSIYQAICSFLNSDGGIVIWGAPKGKKVEGRKEKEFLGDLTPIDRVLEKDFLINKVSDNIIPLPNSIKVAILENGGYSVVVFEVNKSNYAPHQSNNIYYMRLDGQSKPAPHHYVEALFKQIKYPEIGGYLKFESLEVKKWVYLLKIKVILMNHSSLQNEEDVSFTLTCNNGIFILPGWSDFEFKNRNPSLKENSNQLLYENFAGILHYGSVPYYQTTIRYESTDLQRENFESHLILMFGGKKSPMKRSEYKLKMNSDDFQNINDLITYINENQLIYEFGISKGTEEEKIKTILGR